MLKIQLKSEKAPAAIGPYLQGISCAGFIFTSGQLPMGGDGKIVEGGIEKQAEKVIENLALVLKEGGCTLSDVVKTTVFLKDMNDFTAVNAVYSKHFPSPCPARSCIEVARLPKDALIEIEAVAAKNA